MTLFRRVSYLNRGLCDKVNNDTIPSYRRLLFPSKHRQAPTPKYTISSIVAIRCNCCNWDSYFSRSDTCMLHVPDSEAVNLGTTISPKEKRLTSQKNPSGGSCAGGAFPERGLRQSLTCRQRHLFGTSPQELIFSPKRHHNVGTSARYKYIT